MVKSSSDSQHKPICLSTGQAAKRMNVSKSTVRDLCRRGVLPSAFQERESGPWRIPLEAVNVWIEGRASKTVGGTRAEPEPLVPPIWRKRLRSVVEVLVVIVGLLGCISVIADLGGARQQLQEWGRHWGWIRAFPRAREDEVLIVVASFHHSTGVADTEVHNEIHRAIQEAGQELEFSHLRVEVEPTRLTADNRTGAEKLGKRYNASMVVWGSDTGVRIIVNFLNLKQPDFEAAEVQISETARTQLANPSAYASFVTQDLPGQLTFLALFTISQSYYIEEAYEDSIRVIEEAIVSVAPEAEPLQGLAEAHFRLGWLYFHTDDLERAIDNYDQAVALKPEYAFAYNGRGVARALQNDLVGAIADLDQAIALKPDDASFYRNRGIAYAQQGIWASAIANYDQAIALNPNYEAYASRAFFRWARGDLAGAIADCDQAIALNPHSARAYRTRGLARALQDDLEGAITDFNQAIELDPDFVATYVNRGNARYGQGDLAGAIADCDKAIELDPDYAEAYGLWGKVRYAQGDLEGAIADYSQAIALEPDNAQRYVDRGFAHLIRGDLEDAIADFDQAIALEPGFANAYVGRGLAYRRLGNLEVAIVDFRFFLELPPNNDTGTLVLSPGNDNREVVEEWIAELEAQLP